jgi:CrcB protein
VNLIGSAVIGLLAALIATGRLHLSTQARTFVFVGILGGFTTFSSFMLDTLTLSHGSDRGLAIANVAVQTLFGLAAVWGGYRVGIALG